MFPSQQWHKKLLKTPTASSKKANKFLTQGKTLIIALKREDGTILHEKTEILALATEFYKKPV